MRLKYTLLALTLTFGAGYFLGTHPLSLQGKAQAGLQPCVNDLLYGRLYNSFNDWNIQARKTHGDTLGNAIPAGLFEGDYIPASCFVMEGPGGYITYYERPYTGDGFDMTIPAFIPNERMEKRRNAL